MKAKEKKPANKPDLRTEAGRREKRAAILKEIPNFRLMDDDFMTKVFEDKACAELLLDIILDIPGLEVKESHTQYSIKNLQGRSVRLDIYAEKDNKRYNIEIQRADKGAGAKRARYNSSLIDTNTSLPGMDTEYLPETYVIFITESDVFGKGLPLYHIDRTIKETGEYFGDEAHIIYVNGEYRGDTKLGKLMEDFSCKNAADMHYKLLAERVRYFKETEEGVAIMCKAVEKLCLESRNEGRSEGRTAFADALKKLSAILKSEGKADQFEEAATNADYAVELFKRYHISY